MALTDCPLRIHSIVHLQPPRLKSTCASAGSDHPLAFPKEMRLLMLGLCACLTAGCSSLSTRDWDEDPPRSEAEELLYLHETFAKNRNKARLESEIHLLDAQGEIVGILKPGLIVHSPGLDDLDDTDLGDNSRRKVLFDLPTGARITRIHESEMDGRRLLGRHWFRSDSRLQTKNSSQRIRR